MHNITNTILVLGVALAFPEESPPGKPRQGTLMRDFSNTLEQPVSFSILRLCPFTHQSQSIFFYFGSLTAFCYEEDIYMIPARQQARYVRY